MGPSDCQKAAESAYLDLEWINKEPSDEVQKGCVMDSEREAWFNSRETGSEEGSETNVSPICKQGKKHFSTKDLHIGIAQSILKSNV